MSNIDWEAVEKALKIKEIDEQAAEFMLMQALGDGFLEIEVSSSSTDNLPDPGEPDRPVDYGVDGYSDSQDPRQQNARFHSGRNNGPATAVHTLVLTNPSKPYKCSYVNAYGPNHQKGGGKTLILVDQGGDHNTVMLGTGASKIRGDYDQRIAHLPGQDLVIAGEGVKFGPPNLGPASVFLVDDRGQIISDEVRSMGLPGGDHFCFEVRFERRS